MQKKNLVGYTLSHLSLVQLFSDLSVELPDQDSGTNLILFAIRGCRPTQAITGRISRSLGWTDHVQLLPTRVDHVHMRCTLGIWDRSRKKVFAAIGSTVPHLDQVEKSAARKGKAKGKGSNQLEPGFYLDLTKGEHLQGKKNGHQALRQTASRFYRRSPSGFPYSETSPLFFGNPYDNLHCAWNLDSNRAGFSSAGCLVVAGLPHCERQEHPLENQGPWKNFHNMIYKVDQKTFPLLLISWNKLRKAGGGLGKFKNMIYGSSGALVRELQKELAASGHYRGRLHGRMDSRTYKAWKA